MEKKHIYKFLIYFFVYLSIIYYFDLKYYPQLDDYIQHYNYMQFRTFEENIKVLGLLSTFRPIAHLLDLTLWTFLFGSCFSIFLIAFLNVVNAFLLKNIFKKYFELSDLFLIIYLFIPIGIEGNYWISASSRIVVGVFFGVLSIYYYQKKLILNINKKNFLFDLFIFCILQFVGICFYEQVLIFNILLFIFINFLEIFLTKNIKLIFFNIIPIINFLLLFLFKKINSVNSVYSSRIEFILPSNSLEYLQKKEYLLKNLNTLFFDANYNLLKNGFFNGINIILQNINFISLFFLILFFLVLFKLKENYQNYSNFKNLFKILSILFSLIIIFMPISIFFVIKSNYISFRNINTSIFGISLLLDIIFNFIFNNNIKVLKFLNKTICYIVFVLFFIVNISEVYNYKLNNYYDNKISKLIINEIEDLGSDDNVLIFNLKDFYINNQNFYYNEHIIGTTSSNWALKGNIMYNKNSKNIPNFYLHKGNIILDFEDNFNFKNKFQKILYLDDSNNNFRIYELRIEQFDTNEYNLNAYYNNKFIKKFVLSIDKNKIELLE